MEIKTIGGGVVLAESTDPYGNSEKFVTIRDRDLNSVIAQLAVARDTRVKELEKEAKSSLETAATLKGVTQ